MKIISLQGKEYRGEIIGKSNDCRSLDIYKVRLEDGRVCMTHINNIRDVKIKGSAKIDFNKFEDDDNKRFLTIDITTKSNNIENAESLLDKITELMESYENYIKFSRCNATVGKDSISDGFILEYNHGEMKDTKEYIKDLFKQAKKELKIK